ncbi:hypothetical protein BDR26DRAFT_875562 [Obelidium mucronatum]|nr:hypothetical protein BDR26DRAFT_875562 [Obelidium mucronatum]
MLRNQASQTTSQSVLKLIGQARTSGRLNLANHGLADVPAALFAADSAGGDGAGDSRWWEAVDLTRLVLADNCLAALDARIAGLRALTLLDAHNNCLTALPDLSPLASLTVLQLAANNIAAVPDSLFALPLAELHLAGNKLAALSIPPGSAMALSICILDISNNALTQLPTQNTPLPRLAKLLVKSNQLVGDVTATLAASARPCFPLLNHLDISHNRLATLSTLAFHAPNLILLNASQNQLTRLFTGAIQSNQTAINLPGLMQLDVRVNRLESLSTTCQIYTPLLKDLLLQGNKLSTISGSGIVESALKSIETLDIRDNNLDSIPQQVVDMPELKRLFVEGNAIRNPRRAVLEKGTAAIVLWMKERVAA